MRQFLLKNLTRNEDGGFRWRMNLEGLHRNYPNINLLTAPKTPYEGDVLFVTGEKSDYVGDSDQRDILQSFPRAQIIPVNGAGHWVHADAPQAFLDVVMKFLR
jgi:pimeloyl-ACP methyl ester carboxylesterase